jgi:hypothetical protein
MAPTDAVSVIQQILSGQDGTIASLNRSEATIRRFAGQAAATTVNSPAERATIRRDEHAVKVAERQEQHLRRIERLLERQVAHRVELEVHGAGKPTPAEIKRWVTALNHEIATGKVRIHVK